MSFSSGGRATYNSDNGRVIYGVDGRVITGYWIENSSGQVCETERDGSLYWGRIVFEFNDTFTAFSGKWGYCNDEPASAWDGTRREG
jgi:hypothetical protein